MQMNNLERFINKVKANRMGYGMVVTLSDPTVSEAAGVIGFDFTWIDAEHNPLSLETIAMHIMAVRGTKCAPFVRVPWNEPGVIKPILDMAPAGIIIPMINCMEEAEDAVASCRYPPRGKRGCGPRRGRDYWQTPLGEYLDESLEDPMVILQIEHIQVLKNLDKILKVPGINSICVGPSDLALSMGKLTDMNDPELNKVIDEICYKTRKAGILLGTAGMSLADWRRRKGNWMALTSDSSSMVSNARNLLKHAVTTEIETETEKTETQFKEECLKIY